MSYPDLPSEILDLIVDFLYDEPGTLGQCCLVSKSWVPRTRKHLFTMVVFRTNFDLQVWKKTFPDPPKSPAHYTQALTIWCPGAITEADGADDGWISTFSHLVRLKVEGSLNSYDGSRVDLAPFHKVSPTLKSLFITSSPFPLSQFFNLIGSLPLLEDLSLVGSVDHINDYDPGDPHAVVPSSAPPPFTGLLDLRLYVGNEDAANRLLNMPNGLHFRGLRLQWFKWKLPRYVIQLVTACSDTLEFLDITCMGKGAASFCWNGHLL